MAHCHLSFACVAYTLILLCYGEELSFEKETERRVRTVDACKIKDGFPGPDGRVKVTFKGETIVEGDRSFGIDVEPPTVCPCTTKNRNRIVVVFWVFVRRPLTIRIFFTV